MQVKHDSNGENHPSSTTPDISTAPAYENHTSQVKSEPEGQLALDPNVTEHEDVYSSNSDTQNTPSTTSESPSINIESVAPEISTIRSSRAREQHWLAQVLRFREEDDRRMLLGIRKIVRLILDLMKSHQLDREVFEACKEIAREVTGLVDSDKRDEFIQLMELYVSSGSSSEGWGD